MRIRPETRDDWPAVRAVHETAFETPAEADLVEALREQAAPLVSLVACIEDAVAGHILFSPITLAEHPELHVLGLAPMAVIPARQREGIGSALVRAGLEECRRLAADAVVVLGHANFYPRFGFSRADAFGIGCEYDVPPEVFMALELRPGAFTGVSGVVRYHSAFRGV